MTQIINAATIAILLSLLLSSYSNPFTDSLRSLFEGTGLIIFSLGFLPLFDALSGGKLTRFLTEQIRK